VPEVIAIGNTEQEQFLILEWIESSAGGQLSQEKLAIHLAAVHQRTNTQFGLHRSNYMGALIQTNEFNSDWSEFFIRERLMPQAGLALQSGMLARTEAKDFDKLYERIGLLYPKESPALVHGDLWGGNYLVSKSGSPILIDPAVSYSNREIDLAMTTLFGGFQKHFYEAYNESYPLQQDWETRLDLWNLYPLLIHLNIFGKSYLPQVKTALNQYL